MVLHDGALPGREGLRERPAKANTDVEVAELGSLVDGTRVFRHVQARDADLTALAHDAHAIVEHLSRHFASRGLAHAAGLEADAVHSTVDLSVGFGAEHTGDEVLESALLAEVDGLAAEGSGLCEALGDHVADDDTGGAEEVAGGGGGEANRARAGDVGDGARADAGGDSAMETRGQNVGEESEVGDLLHGLFGVGEAEEVEVSVGDHDVFRLAANPTAHVDVAVGGTRTSRVHVEADAGVATLAGGATAASNVERDGADVAFVDELAIRAGFHDLAGDLVAKNHVA